MVQPRLSSPPMAVHESTLRVRYGETDQGGVVYHANYLTYFEQGRTEWLRDHGIVYRDLEAGGIRLAVVRSDVRHHGPVCYDQLLLVATRLVSAGPARIAFAYEIRADGHEEVLCSGSTELACLDTNGRPRRLPESVGTLLADA